MRGGASASDDERSVTQYQRDAGSGSGSSRSGPYTPPWTCGALPPTAVKKPSSPHPSLCCLLTSETCDCHDF